MAFLSDNEEEEETSNSGLGGLRGHGGLKTASAARDLELPTVELSLPNHSRMTQTPKFGLFQVPKVRGSLLLGRLDSGLGVARINFTPKIEVHTPYAAL